MLRPELRGGAVCRLALAYSTATNGLVLTPFLVTAIMARFRLDEGTATGIASLEILGVALSCALLPRWIARAANALTVVGLIGAIVAQILSALAPTAMAISVARGVAGVFEGILFVVVASGISHRRSADRLWGLLNLIAGGVNGTVLVAASLLPERWIGHWLFLMLAALIVIMTPAIAKAGQYASIGNSRATKQKPVDLPKRLVFSIWLVTVLIYGIQASQWAVAGVVGAHAGLSPSTIGVLLSVSSLLGFAGAIVPSQRAVHAHRLKIIWLAQIAMIGSIIGFFSSTSSSSYFFSQLVLNCSLFVVIPFLTGLLSEIDPDGSLVSRTVVITFIGAGAGTALAGGLFDYFGSQQFAILLCIGITVAFPFVWSALRGASRHAESTTSQPMSS
ncbi:MFS transporter [Burkholderia sp. Bp8989]|nr:MFS transporter [Burkholderia sp. Bp8995]RQS48579.1 MFS transporter [Burkholderia sp. Bp8989]